MKNNDITNVGLIILFVSLIHLIYLVLKIIYIIGDSLF